jgi:hypothetical protein
MTLDIESEQARFIVRLRGARAVGKFLGEVPKSVDETIRLFEARLYSACKTESAKLMNNGAWVVFGQLATNACDQMIALSPETTDKVEVIRR